MFAEGIEMEKELKIRWLLRWREEMIGFVDVLTHL
jgi:hypothetical protein